MPLLTLLYRTGVVDEERFSALPTEYGIALSPERLRTFAWITRTTENEISAMLLTRYDGACCDLSGLDPASPGTSSRAALGTWAYFVGSHACPSCLAEDRVWRLRWKLPWSFACVDHGTLLVDTCPACHRRISTGRRDGRSSPAFPSIVPNPIACRNALPKGSALPGRSSRPCGHNLCTVEAPRAFHSSALFAQRRIDAVLSGAEVYVAGEAVSTLEYFRDLRSLCALLLSVGEPEDLSEATGSTCRAFAEHVRGRSELEEQRRRMVASGEDWRAGPRARPYTGPPESAALMAAVIPPAMRMLDAASTKELAGELETFVERVHETRGRASQRFDYFRFSPRLKRAFDLCWRSHQKLTIRLDMGRGKCREEKLNGLTPDHVPQLFWKEQFEARLAELLPGIQSDHARRVCSMWIVKVIVDSTWEEVAEELGLPPRRSRAMANKLVSLLNATGKAELFHARLLEVTARVADVSRRTDFGARRRVLADFVEFERGQWEEICRKAEINPGKRGGRSCYAATWLWCYLTGGDYRLSPWLNHNDGESTRECYWRFVRKDLDSLEYVLVEYGVSLLAEKGVPIDGEGVRLQVIYSVASAGVEGVTA